MEKPNTTFVEYANWPEWIKVATGLYVKKVIPKDPKVVRKLSLFNLLIGALVLIMGLSGDANRILKFPLVFLGFLNIILGIINFFYGYKMYQWVTQNSSWEERFSHKSSGKHQFQYLLMFAVIAAISYGFACFLCC